MAECENMQTSKIYFKGLNELRAISAISVIIHHIELFKNSNGYDSLCDSFMRTFIYLLGKAGVYLFFVLSGFLITYLLLEEKHSKNVISLKKFYMRRILRIWPLYYLLLFISFFLIPVFVSNKFVDLGENTFVWLILEFNKSNITNQFILFVLFFPNIALHFYKPVVGISQAWSVGVEEQFYIIWPLLIQFSKKYLLVVMILIISIKLFGNWILPLINLKYPIPHFSIINLIIIDFKIELMSLGGIGAYILFYYYKLINNLVIYNKLITLSLCILILVFIFMGIHYMILGFLFLCLIFLSINNKSRLFDNLILDSLGKISYGIYMYHPLVMFIVMSLIFKTNLLASNMLLGNFLAYSITIVCTILLSFFSFNYIEKRFVVYKEKYKF